MWPNTTVKVLILEILAFADLRHHQGLKMLCYIIFADP